MTQPITEPPAPDGGWASETVCVDGAIVVPPAESGMVQACGVLDADGKHVPASVTWRGGRAMMAAPARPEPAAVLKGRHLFAGQLWAHFGHFIAESLSRLWALDALEEPVESIIFIPKRPGRTMSLKPFQREFLDLLGIDIPVQILTEPTQVEQLVVPGQGFGLGAICRGTPAFRRFFARRFAKGVAPEGGRRLYISRSALGGREGGALMETVLEDNLKHDGYEIMHPQRLSLAEQVARYRAAHQVVGLDGSAFHMFGFATSQPKDVAILLRRDSTVHQNLARQILGFTGREPTVIDALRANWLPEDRDRPDRNSFGQLDFEVLAGVLQASGFIESAGAWKIPRFRDIRRAADALSQRTGLAYVQHKRAPSKSAAAA